MQKRIAAIIAMGFMTSLAHATSPNTTAANSVPYEMGQGYVSHYFDENTTNRWFRFGELGGRSYCIEAVQGPVSPIQIDPNVTVYTDTTGATVLTVDSIAQSNDNGAGDPYQINGARTCYISPTTTFGAVTVRSVKVNVPISAGSGDSGYVKFRVVDTTLVGSLIDTVSYMSKTNRTSASIKWFGSQPASSTTLNPTTYTYTLTGGQSNYAGSFNGYMNGGVTYVAHNGPPGGLTVKVRSNAAASGVDGGGSPVSMLVPVDVILYPR